MGQALTDWAVVLAVISILIGVGFSVMSMKPPKYRLARAFFSLAALILIARTAWWLAAASAPSQMSNAQLKEATRDLARDLRDLQRKHNEATDLRSNQRMTAMRGAQTEEERRRVWQEQTLQDSLAYGEFVDEFGPLRSRGIALRDELVRRLRVGNGQPEVDLERYAKLTLDDGMLAGVSPLRNLADYLESLAVSLPD